MRDKLVSLEAVKCALESSYYGEATLGELLETIDELSPVKQPMSAVEYETALGTMDDSSVDGFKAKREWHDAIKLGLIERAVAIVKKWAEEHPEERSEE